LSFYSKFLIYFGVFPQKQIHSLVLGIFAFCLGLGTFPERSRADYCSVAVLGRFFRNTPNLKPEEILPNPNEFAHWAPRVREAFARGAWESELLNPANPSAPIIHRVAAQLYFSEELTAQQLGTLGSRFGAWHDLAGLFLAPMRSYPMLDANGRLTQTAAKIFSFDSEHPRTMQLHRGQQLAFEAEIRKLPVSERHFTVLALKPYIGDMALMEDFSLSAMSVWANSQLGFAFEPKGMTLDLGTDRFQIPHLIWSIGVHQALLNVHFGDDAVHLVPETGLASISDLAVHMSNGGRSVVVAWPGTRLPAIIDGGPSHFLATSEHDLLHALSASTIAKNYRMLLGRTLYLREQNKALLRTPAFQNAMPKEKYRDLSYLLAELINMRPLSQILPAKAPQSYAARLVYDVGNAFAALTFADLQTHPEWYRERGLNPEALRAELASPVITHLASRIPVR
jgi:hypothetical protein